MVLFELANFYYATKNHRTACEYYEKALEKRPDMQDILLFAGMNHIELNEPDKALELLLKARDIAPDDDIILYHIGRVYYQKGNYEAAKQFLMDSYSLYQGVDTANLLAMSLFALGEYEHSMHLAKHILKMLPDNVNALLLAAKTAVELMNIDEAKEYLEKIMEIFPDQPEAKELYEKIKGE